MTLLRFLTLALFAAITASCGEARPPQAGQPMSANDFRRELIGMPLCGTPKSGQFAGRLMCTVYLADGAAILAGSGALARGFWDSDGRNVCRRDALETPDKRHCVSYERLAGNRYRNSDGIEFCIGPCP